MKTDVISRDLINDAATCSGHLEESLRPQSTDSGEGDVLGGSPLHAGARPRLPALEPPHQARASAGCRRVRVSGQLQAQTSSTPRAAGGPW